MNKEVVSSFIKAGPWAVLAGALIVYGILEVRPALALIPAIRAEHAEMRAEQIATWKEALTYAKRSAYLERRNCINTARNEDQRDACAKDQD